MMTPLLSWPGKEEGHFRTEEELNGVPGTGVAVWTSFRNVNVTFRPQTGSLPGRGHVTC